MNIAEITCLLHVTENMSTRFRNNFLIFAVVVAGVNLTPLMTLRVKLFSNSPVDAKVKNKLLNVTM